MSHISPSISEASTIFEGRKVEVRRYLDLLVAIRDSRAEGLSMTGPDGVLVPVVGYSLSRDLQKTLQATGYLMLYNLVESTMTNIIDSIHREIVISGVGFDGLSANVRAVLLRNVRRVFETQRDKLLDLSTPVGRVLVDLGYRKDDLFSGNLDGRKIKETANTYGFRIAGHDQSLSRGGSRLVQIKSKRNELAHGQISFEQCGHDTSVDELLGLYEETVIFLGAVVQGVEEYLRAAHYRSVPA